MLISCSKQRAAGAFLGFKKHRGKERILANWDFRVRGNPCTKAQWQKGYSLGSPKIFYTPESLSFFHWHHGLQWGRVHSCQQNSPFVLSSSSSTRNCNFSQFSLAFMPELREIPLMKANEKAFFSLRHSKANWKSPGIKNDHFLEEATHAKQKWSES